MTAADRTQARMARGGENLSSATPETIAAGVQARDEAIRAKAKRVGSDVWDYIGAQRERYLSTSPHFLGEVLEAVNEAERLEVWMIDERGERTSAESMYLIHWGGTGVLSVTLGSDEGIAKLIGKEPGFSLGTPIRIKRQPPQEQYTVIGQDGGGNGVYAVFPAKSPEEAKHRFVRSGFTYMGISVGAIGIDGMRDMSPSIHPR